MKPVNQTDECFQKQQAAMRPRGRHPESRRTGIWARFMARPEGVKRELYLDAYDSVVSDSCRWPFSFRNVCEMLNLSPENVRPEQG